MPTDILEYVKVLVWPITAILLLLLIRPQLRALLTSSKIKVSMFGVAIETTLPELESAINEYLGGTLEPDQMKYLDALYHDTEKAYPTGINHPESQLVRPLRNSGLVRTIPANSSLGSSRAVRLTDLGIFLMRRKSNN
jgi:hypothetical protein